MKRNASLITLLAVLSLPFLITSCLNDGLLDNESEEKNLTEISALAENESDDVMEMLTEAEASVTAEDARVTGWDYPCAEVTNDTENNILTIDFGTGCVGPYGRTRSGKIIVAYDGDLSQGFDRVITFDNYVVNNRKVGGEIEVFNTRDNQDGSRESTKKLVDFKVEFPNGHSVSYNGNRSRLWTEGVADGDPSNNVFEITGSVTGTWSNGRTFTHTIVEPVISKWSCAANGGFARVAGVVEVQRLNGFINRTRITDYGNGECDNVITVTIGQRVYTITLSSTSN